MANPPMKFFSAQPSPNYPTSDGLYAALDAEFHFDFDPCPFNPEFIAGSDSDGLLQPWTGRRVFINPPFGKEIPRFLAKASEANVAVFLLPARTDTKWFHEIVLPKATEVRFLKGRQWYASVNGKRPAPPFPSMIVIFRAAEVAGAD